MTKTVQKITPFLWFPKEAEEAARFYVSIFENARIVSTSPIATSFEIEGMAFVALNGRQDRTFTEAVSFNVSCTTQAEVDTLWEKLLSGGGSPSKCGWLTDRYGLSWQVIPDALTTYIGDPDPEKANRVVQAMLTMSKIDIAALERAHAGR
jgi:predicted 3-demethylubiquinone-9 3-methyltransferase (glyoxalase superfamily)